MLAGFVIITKDPLSALYYIAAGMDCYYSLTKQPANVQIEPKDPLALVKARCLNNGIL